MLNKKIQLAILDEIAKKCDGINPVKIDLTDHQRYGNYQVLHDEGCFVYYFEEQDNKGFLGLSKKGHQIHAELAVEVAKERLERERDDRDRARFRYEKAAICISVIAIIISVVALVRSW